MIWPAALSGAAVRVLRGVAGRRALHVALLVGGVFALALVSGERAEAAESAPSVTASVTTPAVATSSATTAVTSPAATSALSPAVTSAVSPAVSSAAKVTGAVAPDGPTAASDATSAPASRDSLRPLAEQSATRPHDPAGHLAGALRDASEGAVGGLGKSGERVVTGLGEGGERLADGLGGVRDRVPPRAALPTLPPSAALPTLPQPLPAPVTGTPEPGPTDNGPADRRHVGRSTDTAVGTAYDPGLPVAPAYATWHRAQDHGRSVPAAHAVVPTPLQQAPGGEPDGALGSRAAADGGSSRYGDPQAVSPVQRAPFRLAPGAAVSVDAAGTRDRYRDIPVFPG
ncbi:hypothetical protein AB0M97_08190 [Streptomyces sp. NPDC051207]|uniref:hypothetical protein n=1 Tax=Streptomyces sp. NPDC051207 TaxID=3154641 RepID=UPI003445364E